MDNKAITTASALSEYAFEGNLISSYELQKAWKGTDETIKAAIKTHRLFGIAKFPREIEYPIFFAQTKKYNKNKLGKVSQLLRNVSAASKYEFFTNKSNVLNGLTPLQALEQGKFYQVCSAAVCFSLDVCPLPSFSRNKSLKKN